MPSGDEISAAEELVEVLEVFHSATEIVSHKLLSHTLAEAENDKRLTKRIKKAIMDDLTSRYHDVVKKKLSIACIWILELKLCLFWMTQRGMMSCSV